MNKAEFDALPGGYPHPEREKLMEAARRWRRMEEQAYHSMSGADVAEAPCHGMTADALACVADGKNLARTLAFFEAKWRKYAAEQASRVAAAPKIRRGPSAGHSVIGHRWVSPERFGDAARMIRALAECRADCACERGSTCDKSHDPSLCPCEQCRTAETAAFGTATNREKAS